MKVLIAPWGNFRRWEEINYCYEDLEKTSKSSFPLVKEKENPSKTVIIVSDTLIDNITNNNDISSYSSLKQKVERDVVDFCNQSIGIVPDKVVISYGSGEFANVKFLGNSMDFYYGVFRELSLIFSQFVHEIGEGEEIEVIFDATHGINYTTLLSYRALREILEILAYGFSVKLKVLNTDPFVGASKEKGTFNINVIEETRILPRIVVYGFNSSRAIAPWGRIDKHLGENPKEEIGRQIDNFMETLGDIHAFESRVLIFLGSLFFALPVFLLNYIMPSDEILDKLLKISEEFERNIFFSSSQKIEVLRKIEFRGFFSNIIKAFLVSSILERLGVKKLEEIPLSEIIELKRKVFDKFKVESNRIDNEIAKIKEWKIPQDEYKLYSLVVGERLKNVSERNFFAHAGFEQNAIELKCISLSENEKEIFIRIFDENREASENLIKKGLPGI